MSCEALVSHLYYTVISTAKNLKLLCHKYCCKYYCFVRFISRIWSVFVIMLLTSRRHGEHSDLQKRRNGVNLYLVLAIVAIPHSSLRTVSQAAISAHAITAIRNHYHYNKE